MINRLIPEIIPIIIPLINQRTVDEVVASGGTLYAVRTILSQEIITDTAHITAKKFKDCSVGNWKDTGRKIPQDGNTVGNPPR